MHTDIYRVESDDVEYLASVTFITVLLDVQ
jgi:hypothetical protein